MVDFPWRFVNLQECFGDLCSAISGILGILGSLDLGGTKNVGIPGFGLSILGGFDKFLGVFFARVTWGEINTWMVPG